MNGEDILAYGMIAIGGCVAARSIYLSFTAWLDDYLAQAFGDRCNDAADVRYAVTPWGDIAWPVDARCPVDFADGKPATGNSYRAGELAKSSDGLRGKHFKRIQVQNVTSTSSLNQPANCAGQVGE